MHYVHSFKILLLVTIQIALLVISIRQVSSQSVDVEPISLEDLRRLDEIVQKYPILEKLTKSQQETISKLEVSLADEKRTNELNQREIYLLNKTNELKDQEIAIINRANDRLKEITDRAIKLAEVSKPKSNWQVMGLAGLALFLAGFVLGK